MGQSYAIDYRNYDYIIVGAGSAGAIVAARLSEDPDTEVLLLEAGREDNSYWSKIPLGFAKIIFDEQYMWLNHKSEPEPGLNNKQYSLPHGKMIGGSSAVNGLVVVRGAPSDYDNWQKMGAEGWSYEDVLPYFKKFERDHRGEGKYHGGAGPIGVDLAQWKNPLADDFIDAVANSLGVPRNNDFNTPNIEGTGYWDLSAWDGRRSATSTGYIQPNRGRPNLTILSRAFVTKVEFDGKAATDVVYKRYGQLHHVRANREIILSAGALQTPQLLQLSGIGPADLLKEFDIDVIHDLKGVGQNLINHPQIARNYTTTNEYTFNEKVGSIFAKMKTGINYYLGAQNSPLNIGASLAGAYLYTREGIESPDLQLHFLPFMAGDKVWNLADFSGFHIGMYQCQPSSRGRVRITSPDPEVSPSCLFNFLREEEDIQTLVRGMKMAKKVGDAMPAEYNIKEISPAEQGDTDEGLVEYIRNNAYIAHHFAGTAKMGSDDMAVVDPQLRVRGVDNLRVIDASVMPTLSSGNINAAVLMIGEKGADHVKAG